MKRFKIKNPVLRWFAGLGAILVGIVVAFGAFAGMLFGLGKLTLSIWEKMPTIVLTPPNEVLQAGVLSLAAICIGFVILAGTFFGVQWTGNYLFNQIPAKSEGVNLA